MSANLLPKTPVISDWVGNAASQLKALGISSAQLDAEIILAHTLRKSRTFLHAHNDDTLSARQLEIADARLRLRLDRTPIAYIVGHKEFYGRMFRITPATLIPRPESETIIELVKEIAPNGALDLAEPSLELVDVGTGSGCLGITIKLELPKLDVTLLDISNHALKVAESNAKHLKASVRIIRSNLLTNYSLNATIIIANLPYVDRVWDCSPETSYEPDVALFAEDGGLHLIKELLPQAASHLVKMGSLLLEADPRQHTTIISSAKQYGLRWIETRGYIVHLQKI